MHVSAGPQEPYPWAEDRVTAVGRYMSKREYTFVRRVLARVERPRRMLDLGCGSGEVSRALKDVAHRMVGLDISHDALAAFRGRAPLAWLVRADSRRLPFSGASFDCVLAMQTLDYVELEAFLQECSHVLRPGGLLIFDALNRHSYKWHLKNRAGRALALPSANLDYQQILRAAGAQGFAIQAVSGYSWPPFTRNSNSRFVAVADRIESLLRLDHLYQISPKILVAAKKRRS